MLKVLSSTGLSKSGARLLCTLSRIAMSSTMDTNRMSSSIANGCCNSKRQFLILSSSLRMAGRPVPYDILQTIRSALHRDTNGTYWCSKMYRQNQVRAEITSCRSLVEVDTLLACILFRSSGQALCIAVHDWSAKHAPMFPTK